MYSNVYMQALALCKSWVSLVFAFNSSGCNSYFWQEILTVRLPLLNSAKFISPKLKCKIVTSLTVASSSLYPSAHVLHA